ncbi:MAG: multiheme c-type cytochrome [Planctomycetota bacterium]|jgi:predicted CXXCH cytochrome family protein
MRFWFLAGVVAVGLFALVGPRFAVDDRQPAPIAAKPPVPVEREAVDGFVGSAMCGECHKEEYERWAPSGHAISIAPFSDEFAARPFDGSYFVARDIEHKMGPDGTMTCEGPGGETQRYRIDTIVGVRRIQMFTTRMSGGRIQVLPVMLEVPKQRWFDYAHFIFGGPPKFDIPKDSPNSWYTFARNFNSRCVRCHVTNPKIGYDADTGTYESSWSELAIGCEACHGEGGAHVTKWRRLEDGPDPIVDLAGLPTERGNMVCGRCHSESFMVQPGYEPGGDLWSFMDPNGLEDRKHVHPDGRARELIHNMLPIMQSPCGPFSCSDCHEPHGSSHSGDLRNPLTDDTVCTKCHTDIAGALTAHTHHKASSTGSRCVNCHMPRLVIEAGHGWTHDHTISIPSVENSEVAGLPNACASCHLLEDFKWEYESFRRWYPDAEKNNHRVALAAAFAGGREKKPEAKRLLKKYARNENPVYRAGAVRLLAGYDVDLAAALEDPSPLVRRAAIEGVKRSEPARLVPLLDDENHVLRYRAALALAERAARKDPELRQKVIAVLQSFAAKRPDVDATHYALAVLFDAAADSAQAVASYERYLRINPWDQPARQRMESLRGHQ